MKPNIKKMARVVNKKIHRSYLGFNTNKYIDNVNISCWFSDNDTLHIAAIDPSQSWYKNVATIVFSSKYATVYDIRLSEGKDGYEKSCGTLEKLQHLIILFNKWGIDYDKKVGCGTLVQYETKSN